MISNKDQFITEIESALGVPQPYRYKVIYGKVADIIPIPEIIREFAEEAWKKNKESCEKRLKKLEFLDAPEVILVNQRKQLTKMETFEIWLKKTAVGSAFRKIHNIK